MPSGPLAFLPLFNGECSIVWSLDEAEATRVMALDETHFKKELAAAAEFKLGEIVDVGQRFLFPLSHSHVNEYVKPGLALIGDAAHSIHPLAGQGANLGIADAIALAEIISDAKKANRQWAALHTLKKNQRQRKGANQLMETSMTGFKELFGNKNSVLSEVRNAGLSLVDHLPALKYKIIQQAIG
jgi:2-octaprenylphenol hydroxylase